MPLILPSSFADSMAAQLGAEYPSFYAALSAPAPVSIRFNSNKSVPIPDHYQKVPWCENGYYLPQRPSFTKDPLLHAGAYYVQEASSMFLYHVLKQLDLAENCLALDLCAAPGGKSTLLSGFLHSKGQLVSNEIIRSRVSVLEENLVKWGNNNVWVTQTDAKTFGKMEGMFDLMVIDAPCSGEGLFRRDHQAITEWSEQNVNLCCERQQRILADVLPALAQGGYLIYSTCTFAEKENEENVLWLIKTFDLEVVNIPFDADWGVQETEKGCFRFYPHKVLGEGLFMACLRKKGERQQSFFKPRSLDRHYSEITKKNRAPYENWLKEPESQVFILKNEEVYSLPAGWYDTFKLLAVNMPMIYPGTHLGRLVGKDLIPAHALALSEIRSDSILAIEVAEDMALKYLRKGDITLNTTHTGWALLTYKGLSLGWVKVLQNRVNNYYPKEWRILSDK